MPKMRYSRKRGCELQANRSRVFPLRAGVSIPRSEVIH
jgi:hypothetical protein